MWPETVLITLASFWVAQRCLAPDVSTALIESATSPLSLMSATRSSALGHTNPPGSIARIQHEQQQ